MGEEGRDEGEGGDEGAAAEVEGAGEGVGGGGAAWAGSGPSPPLLPPPPPPPPPSRDGGGGTAESEAAWLSRRDRRPPGGRPRMGEGGAGAEVGAAAVGRADVARGPPSSGGAAAAGSLGAAAARQIETCWDGRPAGWSAGRRHRGPGAAARRARGQRILALVRSTRRERVSRNWRRGRVMAHRPGASQTHAQTGPVVPRVRTVCWEWFERRGMNGRLCLKPAPGTAQKREERVGEKERRLLRTRDALFLFYSHTDPRSHSLLGAADLHGWRRGVF